MKRAVVYLHGKGGSPGEAAHYRPLFPDRDVIGLSYEAQTPWEAGEELPRLFDLIRAESITLIANSIGAYFAMSAPVDPRIDRAYFISPVVDMEKLIGNMMLWAGVTEAQLCERKEIATAFGETLSWPYLCYAREHPVQWTVPTHILYGEKDELTSLETIRTFAERIGATLTVMPGGEHWFHTPAQMAFLDRWIGPVMIETDRLLLRPWTEEDAEALYYYASDARVGPAAGWPVHTSVENSREIIRDVLSDPETYAVCLKEDGRPIGSIGLMIGQRSYFRLPEDEGEIGYWLGVPFWGRGLMPEAVRALIRRAFDELGLKRLWCGYFDGNEKSRRAQEKCGFVYHHTNADIYWSLTDEIRTEHVTCLERCLPLSDEVTDTSGGQATDGIRFMPMESKE